jgi:DNA (cytosine-5)-methyltransferase 1
MRYLSVCSGIEAASVAWHPLGWECVGVSEIEPFPSSVLAHHHPNVPNFGDLTKYQEWPDDLAPDLIVGGTPCQSFSVAGLRAGLEDPRGNLALVFLGLVDRYRPRYVVWENVPGVLSSGGGRDFGAFLGALGELGYGWAYRVLDAQYFGLAQRRKRVFVVGYLGDWRPPAAVLLEREGLRGDSPPSREAGQSVAPTVSGGPPFSRTGNERVEAEAMVPFAGPGFSVTGSVSGGYGAKLGTDESCQGSVIVFDTTQMTSKANRSNPQPGDPCHPLVANGDAPAVAFVHQAGGAQTRLGYDPASGTTPTLPKSETLAVAFDAYNLAASKDGTTQTLSSSATDTNHIGAVFVPSMAVRRLTPTECERLQGFPDGYTQVPHRGKPAADGPRYKALGNSMAVPVMAWIGEQIALVDAEAADLLLEEAA